MRSLKRLGVSLAAAMLVAMSIGSGAAFAADDVQHGIGFTKGCASPTNVGDPYTCSYTVRNNLDDAGDTLTINSLVDTVHAASGDVGSGEIIGAVKIVAILGATCVAASGDGSVANPYTGVTSCTLPAAGRLNVLGFSHYTVQPGDFALAGHNLRDDASLGWHDLCDDPLGTGNSNCNANPPNVGAASLSLINQLSSTTATAIHDDAHETVTTVAVGTTVHDFVTVTGQAGQPAATGNVSINWFLNGTCAGTAANNSGPIALAADGTVDATGFPFTVNTAGMRSFQATYAGDARYTGSTGACEPLQVVDARIDITPSATNRINDPHTFTATVHVNDGTGEVLAPNGTHVTFTTVDAGATSTPKPPTACDTTAGSCTTTITSSTTGTSTVTALTTVTVAGVSLDRATDGTHGSSGAAVKTWVNAIITISPNAYNEVNHPHTFVATVLKDAGNGAGLVPAANETVTVTLIPDATACPSPAGPFTGTTDANGTLSVTFTSACAGTVVAHASSTLGVAGSAPFTIQTDSQGGNSGDATKIFQDANIQITPNGTNRVDDSHTFTGHVNADLGGGNGFVNAPDGTEITYTIDSGPGSFLGGIDSCLTVGGTGSCQVAITSAVTGVTTVSAHTSFTTNPGGIVLTRSTDGVGANSGPAVKTWVNAKISIAPSATNEIGQPHTFTATLSKDTGTGTFVPAAGETVTITLTNSNGAAASPAGPFTGTTDANGQFAVTFTSASTGTVTGHASSTLSVNGSTPFSVATDGTSPNSGDAAKTFVDANIQITPATATNAVGTTHVLTLHVDVNPGTGFVNAPAGTSITASILSGPGSFVGSPTCTTVGTTGSCTVTITSAVTGTTVVRGTTTVSVGGLSLTRTTGDSHVGDSADANKTWANAAITITPSATNEVGQPHTFTVTVLNDTGSGLLPVGAGEECNVTLTNGNGAVANPAGPFNQTTNASGQCTVTFTSATAGTVTGHASSMLSVGGIDFTVQTDGTSPNSGDAVKTFVNAKISITPANANNPIGTNHVLTLHVDVNPGTGFVNAPAGTSITASILSGPGSFVGSPTCTTVGTTGSCTVTITSSTTGTTVVRGTTTVSVGGLSLTRTTGDSHVGDSADANKNWANAAVTTQVHNATHQDITGTTVAGGTVVHDQATVSKAPGTPAGVPAPTGTVTFTLYNNGTCNGTVVATSADIALGTESATFTTPISAGGIFSYLAHYNGDANYPAANAACEPFSVRPGQIGLIAPTNTECSDYLNGTAPTLPGIFYKVGGNKIQQSINPGVFFYYSTVTVAAGATISTTQTTTNSSGALFELNQDHAWVYDGACNTVGNMTASANHSTGTFTATKAGTYILRLQYSTKSLAGSAAPSPQDPTYTFGTKVNNVTVPADNASIQLFKQ